MERETLRIGQLAERACVGVETLRYYERVGLLAKPGRTSAGYRAYPIEAVRVVRFVKRAQKLGFTLVEIKELLALSRDRERGCAEVRDVARAKIADIDSKLQDLQRVRDALGTLIESCSDDASAHECPILGALREASQGPRRSGEG